MEALTGIFRDVFGSRALSETVESLVRARAPSVAASARCAGQRRSLEETASAPSVGAGPGFAEQIRGVLMPQLYHSQTGMTHVKRANPDYDQGAVYEGFGEEMQRFIRNFLDLPALKLRPNAPVDGRSTSLECSDFASGTFDSVLASQINEYETLPTRVEPDRPECLTHNNMVPFYKGNLKQNMDIENRMAAGKLELYTGQYLLNRPTKKEVPKLFPPTKGLTNPYGSNTLVTMLEARGDGQAEPSRWNPNNTGKRSNEIPFEHIRVGPGLNQGFGSLPSGGYHDQVRILPKSGEQLFVNSKGAKSELAGRVVRGAHLVTNRGVAAAVHKYRPTLLVDNENGQRNFTTVGEVTGPRGRPGIIMKCTDRTTLTDQIIGPAAPGDHYRHTPEDLMSKTRISHNQNFLNTPYRNAGQVTGKGVNDFGKCGYENLPNERSVTGPRSGDQNFRSLTTWVKELVMRPFDQQRDTLRQEADPHPRPYGNLQPVQPAAPIVVNQEEWQARTTIRETTEDNDHTGQLAVAQHRGTAYDPAGWAAKTTVKETTEDNDHVGTLATVQKRQIAYDPTAWAARTTVKETTEDNDHTGGIDRGTLQSGKGYQAGNWEVKNTQRQFTSDYEYSGVANANHRKARVYDDAYNATLNADKEVIAQGRAPTQNSVKLNKGKEFWNIAVKKIECDELDFGRRVPDSTTRTTHASIGAITSGKNVCDDGYLGTRVDPKLLTAFHRNPLTQSLQSF